MILAALLLAPLWLRESWVEENGVGGEPLYSPYITSPGISSAAQAVNRSSSESEMPVDYSMIHHNDSLFRGL